MASEVAVLRCPSSDCFHPTFGFHRGPELPAPKDDDEDFLAKKVTSIALVSDTYKDDHPYLDTPCPGHRYTKAEEKRIYVKWMNRFLNLCEQHTEMCDDILSNGDDNATLPPGPLKVLPVTTYSCITGGYCYHREFMTNNTSQTSQRLGYSRPKHMLQVFSLQLSHSESCPISVYGIFAVRDDLEPLRNYVFKRPRDDPVTVQQDYLAIPLCSPCRGMYVLDRALLEVDLWIKKEGDGSTDVPLLSVYVEIDIGFSFDEKFTGRIHSDRCMLDMGYMFLSQSVEAVIEVVALVDNPNHVKFVAFSSCFDAEIMLFEGRHVEMGELARHVVAVKANGKLGVRLEFKDSLFEWIFQDGTVVPSSSPDDSILNQFLVRVIFDPKKAHRPSRY